VNFTAENIPSVSTEGITVGKKELKQSQKIRWHVIYTDRINFVSKFVGKLFTSPWHYSSCQLQRESLTEHSVGIFQRALELFTSQLHCWLLFFTGEITDGLKSRQWYLIWQFLKKNLLNWNFKLNITDGITDGNVKNINN